MLLGCLHAIKTSLKTLNILDIICAQVLLNYKSQQVMEKMKKQKCAQISNLRSLIISGELLALMLKFHTIINLILCPLSSFLFEI